MGFPSGWAFALLHRSCGLDTRAFVIGGDAESEEGMSYEARNMAAAVGARNLVVALDYNTFGIDGSIFDAIPAPYMNHWFGLGWNIIQVNGQNIRELAYAYRMAAEGFGPERPTVIMATTTKGIHYGKLENTADSHGSPLPHPEYAQAMHAWASPYRASRAKPPPISPWWWRPWTRMSGRTLPGACKRWRTSRPRMSWCKP